VDWHAIFSQALQQGLGPVAAVYCLAAIGLNVHFGYTGLLNFGQAGFMAVGGYAVASFVATWGLGFWLGSLVGLLAAAVLALLLGVPTLRLRADYLAIVTIAAAEIIRQVIGSVTLLEYFGGQDGLQGFNRSFAGLNPFEGGGRIGIPGVVTWRPYDFWTLLVCWAIVALCCLIVWALMRSPWGRVLKSIREDEDAVRSLGKNVYAYKMQSLVIGGVIGGLAGIMSALQHSAINPSFFATDTTFFAYTVLLVGGAARVFGPVAGTVIFWFLLSFLDLFFGQATAGADPSIPSAIMNSNQASLMRFIFMGLSLMLLMIFRPQGIFGDRRELALDAR
jgi:ABC-type branched-subunit amino acid transport system permease subunit